MYVLDAQNAETYLRERGHIEPAAEVRVEALPGGVSNCVLLVRRLDRQDADFVLKQARPQLDVPEPWFCTVERSWREVEVLRACAAAAGAEHVPTVLFENHDNYLFAMTAAPRKHTVWKDELLSGRADAGVADQCARLLGRIHARTWHSAELAARLADDSIFDALRLDPYYRAVARAHPDARAWFDALIDSTRQNRLALVHGDFSPKNLLVSDGRLMLIDFECGHYGDPAFDLGFFLSHLVLKAFHHAPQHEPYLALTETFWEAYRREITTAAGCEATDALVARSVLHFAGCTWARLDGKSQVDYLTEPARRDAVRDLCREVFCSEPPKWCDVLELCGVGRMKEEG